MMPPREGPPMERRGSRLSRRAFVVSTGAASLAVIVGCGQLLPQAPPPAQRPAKVHRVGVLSITPIPSAAAVLEQALGELGYVDGKNLVIEYRNAENQFPRLPALATELVALPV